MSKTKHYIRSLQPEQHPLLDKMEQYADNHHVPIMERDGIGLLQQLVRLHQPQHILEIGTAIGYSAIQMALATKHASITTIERDDNRFQEATHFIHEAQLHDRIQVIHHDANVWLDELSSDSQTYDLVFVDAAKGQYQAFVEKIDPFVAEGGLIVVDNVLFKGYVAKEVQDNERFVNIGEKINQFNQWLSNHSDYTTTIVESGDGVAIAVKNSQTDSE
ncbi:putative O-methyltransferase YrrM [Alkalibacillus flavidus]|uniref:tRNA 5-hydroxyuridine methyltransferase n=1 Tax=Alkalibacillus flavidus TaxID=546021 RepID=A0ABV2KSE0_9BACI